MLKMSECKRTNRCVDCDDEKCIHAGKIMADCPKHHCDNDEDCENCDFIKKFLEGSLVMSDLISRKHLLALANQDGAYGYVDVKQIIDAPAAYDAEAVADKLEKLETYIATHTMDKHPFCVSEIETISKKQAIDIVRNGIQNLDLSNTK